jgi:hypothetical protein
MHLTASDIDKILRQCKTITEIAKVKDEHTMKETDSFGFKTPYSPVTASLGAIRPPLASELNKAFDGLSGVRANGRKVTINYDDVRKTNEIKIMDIPLGYFVAQSAGGVQRKLYLRMPNGVVAMDTPWSVDSRTDSVYRDYEAVDVTIKVNKVG